MIRQSLFHVLVLLAPFGCGATPNATPEGAGVIAFVDVNIVPMDREVILMHQTVVVRGETLTKIGPIDGTPVPASAFPESKVVESLEDPQRAVADQKSSGYDFTKVLSNLNADVYDAITAGAKEQNIGVVGHVPFRLALITPWRRALGRLNINLLTNV